MKPTRIVLIVAAIVIGAAIAHLELSRKKTGYVLINDLYSKFELRKEYTQKFERTKNERQKILDSLAINLRILANQIQQEKMKNKERIDTYNYKREDFLQKQKTFDEDNAQLIKQYDEQILSQLNQYVKEYGERNGYDYIFGNDGNGSLMYAYESDNVTPHVLAYINTKYQGGQ